MIDKTEEQESGDKGKFAATFQPVAEPEEPPKGSILEAVVVGLAASKSNSSSSSAAVDQDENGVVSSTTAAFGEPIDSLSVPETRKTDKGSSSRLKRRGSRSPGTPTKDERDPSEVSPPNSNDPVPSSEDTSSKTPDVSQTFQEEDSDTAPTSIVETPGTPPNSSSSASSTKASAATVVSSSVGSSSGGALTGLGGRGGKETGTSRRKFRVLNLVYPAALNDETLRSVMDHAHSFHTWFEFGGSGTEKKGGISFQFSSESDAQSAFNRVKTLEIDGNRVKIQAPKHLSNNSSSSSTNEVEVASSNKEPQPSTPSSAELLPERDTESAVQETMKNDEDCRLKLHISQLLPSTQDDLIYALFDKENLKAVHLSLDDRKTDGSKVAILTFLTEDLARDAKREYDGFSVDDGEVSRQIRIMWYLDFVKDKYRKKVYSSLRKSKLHQPADQSSSDTTLDQSKSSAGSEAAELTGTPEEYDLQAPLSNGNGHRAANQWSEQIQTAKQPAPALPEREMRVGKIKEKNEEMSIGQIKGWIESVMTEKRVNWAELSTAQDLWSLLDQVQEQAGWIPDEKLKTGMLKTLESDLASCQADWLHRHLETLIRMWKKETRKETRTDAGLREFQLKAPEYDPPPMVSKKKFRGKEHRRQVIGLMGVGALLAQAREKHQGEEGELKEGEEEYVEAERVEKEEMEREKKEVSVERRGKKRRPPSPSPPKEDRREKRRKKKEKKDQLEEGEMPSSSGEEGSGKSDGDDSSAGSSGRSPSSASTNSEKRGRKGRRSTSSEGSGGGSTSPGDSERSRSRDSPSSGELTDSGDSADRKKKPAEAEKKAKISKSRQKRKEHREKKRRAAEKRQKEERRRAKKEKKAAAAAMAAGPSMADFTKMMQSMQASGGAGMTGMMPQMMTMFQQMWMQRMQMLQKLAPDKQHQTMQKMQTVFQQFQQQYQVQGGGGQPRMGMPGSQAFPAGQQSQADWAQQFRSQVPPPPTNTTQYSAPPTHYYPPPAQQHQPPQHPMNYSVPPPGGPRGQMAYPPQQMGMPPRQQFYGPGHIPPPTHRGGR